MPTNQPNPQDYTVAHQQLIHILNQLETIVLDKPLQCRLALTTILAGGHLLLEDLPGMGKTTLALTLSKLLGLSFNRVQMTNDLLPSDILGGSIFNSKNNEFTFQKGAIFAHVLLADELNRTSPKTQSALLEAMEEGQVSIEGTTHALPQPFTVIATQNSQDQAGTHALPESQLDRFMIRLSLGYPSRTAELQLLMGKNTRDDIAQLQPIADEHLVKHWQQLSKDCYVSEATADYLQRLTMQTRQSAHRYGLSTRGLLALLNASKAFAVLSGRHYVMPEDIMTVFPYVVEHRLSSRKPAEPHLHPHSQEILDNVSIITPIN